MEVYPPKEDSEFLEGFVRKYARGKTLDVGTGSGIQACAAMETQAVTSVVAVDINPAAVRHAKAELEKRRANNSTGTPSEKQATSIQSDMFSQLEDETFDTIICNPPYLPDDSGAKDIALDGGAAGYEWSERFLKEAAQHITPNGQILFLFSNLTNKERIDNTLRKLGYLHEELGECVVGFFERLYVYRIWRRV